MRKAKDFREDKQKFLKDLGLTDDPLIDVDNVNACYTFSLERINSYGKDNATKQKWAKPASQACSDEHDHRSGKPGQVRKAYHRESPKNTGCIETVLLNVVFLTSGMLRMHSFRSSRLFHEWMTTENNAFEESDPLP